MVEIKVKKVNEDAAIKSGSYDGDVAIDLASTEETTLEPMEKKIIRTGIKMAIPKGYAGLIWDRSGMAANHSIHTMAGVIDSGYRGEIQVVLINLGKQDFRIERGMRIAQMLIHAVPDLKIEEVQELDETERGDKAFGSSGK